MASLVLYLFLIFFSGRLSPVPAAEAVGEVPGALSGVQPRGLPLGSGRPRDGLPEDIQAL